ncbi:MAG TPA: alanine racemase [Candidatus Binataceae bacterium]|nr:alanine racemase [Candidatus Binataceae bacterium]
MTARSQRPTVIEIDLGALRRNYHALREAARRAAVMVVVKADAYGHGAVPIARTLAAEGCGHFGVATIAEACELRDAGIKARIYLLGGFFPEQAKEILALEVTPFIFDVSIVAPLNAAAKELGKRDVAVHLKIDTGATRLGVLPSELARAIEELRSATSLRLEGACTLFANAADPTSNITDKQLRVFVDALATLTNAGMRPEIVHADNSAALVLRPDTHFDLVRPGLAIYGLPPVLAVREKIDLTPIMTFKTRLMQMKRVPAGTGVGYGHTFVTERPSVIGILPVGYADGYRRGLQNGCEVLIGGRRAPVIAAVSMDLTEIDLTDVPGAAIGDEVILWGGSGDDTISVNDVARIAQTISYEMLCTVGRRVCRVYLG